MYYFDLNKLLACEKNSKLKYDILKFVASLQGLVNRSECNLYINFIDKADIYWFDKFTGKDGFLHAEFIHAINDIYELIDCFYGYIEGVVLWDENVSATSNVAATICGVEGLIPVRFDISADSLYERIIINGPRLSVRKSLVGIFSGNGYIPDSTRESSGSAKCDAYIWAKEKYLESGLCNRGLMGYLIDAYYWNKSGENYPDLVNTMLCNHDYFIAKKAFFFDLSPWEDEVPNDDMNQPVGTDFTILNELLLTEYRLCGGSRIFTIGGFVPWYVKYTSESLEKCSHGAVETEWKYAEIISCYNGIMDADAYGDAGLANASVFFHYPLKEQYCQPRPADLELENKTYITFYMGDYDSASWSSNNISKIWDNADRGRIPLAWGFNPNLSERVPHVFDYIYDSLTENDHIISGDSGAGYLNPSYLLEPRKYSELPDGMAAWVEHNKKYYEKFDISVTGFIINGHELIDERVQKAYAGFSKDGVGSQEFNNGKYLVDNVAFHEFLCTIIPSNTMDQAAEIIYDAISRSRDRFNLIRCVLLSPSFIVGLTDKIIAEKPEYKIKVIDPYNFFKLKKKNIKKQMEEGG